MRTIHFNRISNGQRPVHNEENESRVLRLQLKILDPGVSRQFRLALSRFSQPI